MVDRTLLPNLFDKEETLEVLEKERPLVYSVAQAAEAVSVSKPLMYQLIREGRVYAVRLSKRRLVVPRKQLEQLLEEEGLT